MNKETKCTKKYFVSLFRVIVLIVVALILPRFFLFSSVSNSKNEAFSKKNHNNFKLGVENISDEFLLQLGNGTLDYDAGLITNQDGIDHNGNNAIDILSQKGINLKSVYIAKNSIPPKKSLWPIGNDKINHAVTTSCNSLIPYHASSWLDNIEVLFFDVQDRGFDTGYTLNLLLDSLQKCALYQKKLVVLDRPNLLGPVMEGLMHDSVTSIPLRHGMTIGELANYCNRNILANPAELFIVTMDNYQRDYVAAMNNNDEALLTNIDTYDGLKEPCLLLDICPFDIGIGSDMNFALVAFPELLQFSKRKWFELRSLLKKQGFESSFYRYQHPLKKTPYVGIKLLPATLNQVSVFSVILSAIKFFQNAGIKCTVAHGFEYKFGSKKIKDFIEGKISRELLEYEVNKDLKNFFNKAYTSFIYKPLPKIILF